MGASAVTMRRIIFETLGLLVAAVVIVFCAALLVVAFVLCRIGEAFRQVHGGPVT